MSKCRVSSHGDDTSWVRLDLPSKCTWDVNNYANQQSPHTWYRPYGSRKRIFFSVLEAIGHTPMVHLNNLEKNMD